MRKFLSALTLFAGAFLVIYVWQQGDSEQVATERLAAMVRIVTEGSRAARPIDEAAPKSAGGVSVAKPVHKVSEGATDLRADRAFQGAHNTAPLRNGIGGGAGAGPAVTQPSAPTGAEPQPLVRRFTSVKPGDEGSKRELTKSIQAELRRVGCFDGEIDGSWSASSRQAMKKFTDRVNATLPIEQPDYILLTLLQGHEDRACGKGCPSGQVAGNDGRCQPRAVVAQEERKQARQPVRPALVNESGREKLGGEAQHAAAARAAQLDAQIVRERALAAAREKEQRALEERRARLEAEKLSRQRAAEEERMRAEQVAEDARRKQALALEQRRIQEMARLEAEREAKARLAEERRAKAALAAADAQRKLELVEAERRQQVEIRREAEQKAATTAAEAEARRRAQFAEAEQARRAAAQSARTAAMVTSSTVVPDSPQKSAETGASIKAVEPGVQNATEPREGAASPRDVSTPDAPVVASVPSRIAPQRRQRSAVRAPEAREEVREVPRAAPRNQPRFVQRFYPPPYYVGRVSIASVPAFVPQPVVVQRRIAPSFNSRIFHDLGRNSP